MMHPSRQAYVEEDHPEVSQFHAIKYTVLRSNVHMVSQRNTGLSLEPSLNHEGHDR